MCADQNRMPGSISSRQENGHNDPIHVAVTIDMNDIYDGALKVLKRIKPFWPINNVQFKVGSKPFKPPHYTFDPPKNLVLCLCVCFFLRVFVVTILRIFYGRIPNLAKECCFY